MFNVYPEVWESSFSCKNDSYPPSGLLVWSLHVLPVITWVLSGYSIFLTQSKDMQLVELGYFNSKFPNSGCLSVCVSLDWRPVQGECCLLAYGRWKIMNCWVLIKVEGVIGQI